MRTKADACTRGKGGFTLLEVMLAMGIFSIVMVAFLQILMGVHRTNAALTASMTANSVIRSQADEALGAAVENAAAFGNYARSLVNFYGTQIAAVNSTADADSLPIGPNGAKVSRVTLENSGNELVYRFAVPEPGFYSRYLADTQTWSDGADAGDLVLYTRGVGEMRIYLDESVMPRQGNLTSREELEGYIIWETKSKDGDAGDGELTNEFTGVASLANPPESFTRAFADITVIYYDDPAQTRTVSINTRRILVIGSIDSRDLFGI